MDGDDTNNANRLDGDSIDVWADKTGNGRNGDDVSQMCLLGTSSGRAVASAERIERGSAAPSVRVVIKERPMPLFL